MATIPLFATGIARGGTSLIGRMIDAHPDAAVAIDAFLPLFRASRNRMIRACPDPRVSSFDFSLPLQDGHFTDSRRAHLDGLLKGSMSAHFPVEELDDLKERLHSRALDESADLAPMIDALDGETIEELIACSLGLVVKARRPNAKVAGFKDLWITDQIPALSRAFPEARFLVILRDPRAIIASILGYLEKDPTQCAHVVSVVRHWRKMVACTNAFSADPAIASRLMVMRYEDMIADPEKQSRRLCTFLELPFATEMTDVAGFQDVVKGGSWQGNSTFDDKLDTISSAPVERWRKTLAGVAVAAVEFCCGPDMEMLGYEGVNDPVALAADSRVLDFIIQDGQREASWRSDFGDPLIDYGFEAARRQMLFSSKTFDHVLVQRAFLFDEYFAALRDHCNGSISSSPLAMQTGAHS